MRFVTFLKVATLISFAILWMLGEYVAIAFLLLLMISLWLTGQFEPRQSNSEHSNAPAGERILISANLRIQYEDADGEPSTRDVDVLYYYPESGYIFGKCKLRRANRTFRLDRIKEAIDRDTGEVIKGLRSFLRKKKIR